MRVRVELRDEKKYREQLLWIMLPFPIFLLLFLGVIGLYRFCQADILLLFLGILGVCFVLFFFIDIVVAAKSYRVTWKMEVLDFTIRDGCLYRETMRLHVNFDESRKAIYLHDLGEGKNPAKVTFYGTVFYPDSQPFYEYLRMNGVRIEREPDIPGITRYRR